MYWTRKCSSFQGQILILEKEMALKYSLFLHNDYKCSTPAGISNISPHFLA